MALEVTRRRFTTADYHRMAESGVLTEDDRVELIDGEILEMSPIGRKHAACVDRVAHLFFRRLGERTIVRVQGPVVLSEHAEPQPDIALLRPRTDFYAAAHPTPEAILLVVEVADSSAEFDRQVKAPLYARSGIPELWLVELDRSHVAVYRDPTSDGYGTTHVLGQGDAISPLAFPDLQIAVAEILG